MNPEMKYSVNKKGNKILFYRDINGKKDCYATICLSKTNEFIANHKPLDLDAVIFVLNYLANEL